MSRLTRAELQLRTRAKVLEAARAEFTEHGYRDAKIDRIADRADLTRGAVYSNFPGKRALYFAALAELADTSRAADPRELRARRRAGAADGLAAFANVCLDRPGPGVDALPELSGTPYAELLGLNALLLGLSLDQISPGQLGRMVRASRLALTMLHGASQLTGTAPGFVQPLAVARACAELPGLELYDPWMSPQSTPPVRPADEPWTPPPVVDEVRRRTADFRPDGVVVVLGLRRLAAVEDVVRTTSDPVTVALVSSDPAELGPLARYTVGGLLGCLRQSLPLPWIQVVHDENGVLASAVGCEVIGDELEYAVRLENGRITARAEGFGAAAAIAGQPTGRTSHRPVPSA
ncbi:TetR/AcrR family transcriptional regulator [Kribbella swartbergensis]